MNNNVVFSVYFFFLLLLSMYRTQYRYSVYEKDLVFPFQIHVLQVKRESVTFVQYKDNKSTSRIET